MQTVSRFALSLGLLAALAPALPAAAQIFMSPQEEKQLGTQEHPKILAQFGGVYDDNNVTGYVAEVGGRLAGHSDNPGIGYTFTLLNSPVVNAFALPGGYVYVTRGLMALANDEAEFAGVVGHEIGHVTARHGAKREGKGTVAGLGIALGSILTGVLTGSSVLAQGVQQLGGAAAQGYLASFSREQEYEADLIGVKVLARTGYAPEAQAEFLQSLADYSAFETERAGRKGTEKGSDWLATHPNTQDRVRRAAEAAGVAGTQANAPTRREEYLKVIDGMIYGDDPSQGFVRGRVFAHPQLRITFTAPEGFKVMNTDTAVVAVQQSSGSQVQFTAEPDPKKAAYDPATYITAIWGQKLGLKRAEAITINGMPGATAAARVNTQSGQVDARFVAIQAEAGKMYRLLFVTPPKSTAALTTEFQRMTYSFRRLNDQEAVALKPQRLRIYTVQRGDTVQSLSARMAVDDMKEQTFRLLNGLRANDEFRVGMKVKLVTE